MYFFGAKKDLSDFDSSVEVSLIQFDAARTFEEMSLYFESLEKEKLTLSNGEERVTFGSSRVEKMGDWQVVAIRSADLFHVGDVQLKGGAHTTLQPYQLY